MTSNYLPLLLVSVTDNAATPDDSSVTTLPTGQVDYLSHQWREEDVWSSWKSMTRQKNAITNGTRLENASWRTWWKQRNKLKDSDVTWLYGPLHPGCDWEPLPKPTPETRPSLAQANVGLSCTKPILKHRSITEILSLPTPQFDADQSPETPVSHEQQPPSNISPHPSRPFLTHTKSDTHILRARTPRDALRKDSPPRVLSKEAAECALSIDDSTSPGTSTGSEQDLMVHNPQSGKKKHISFNTFVEQRIAIENPKPKRPTARFVDEVFEDDGYDEDTEGCFDNPNIPQSSKTYYPTNFDVDSDSDSDDVLEMQTSSSRSRSSSSSRSGPPTLAPTPHSPSPIRNFTLHDDDHRSIAYIPPTILKTNDVYLGPLDPTLQYPGVELVYVPQIRTPKYSPYLRADSLSGTPDIYERQIDYFDPRGSSSQSSSSSNTSPNISSVGIPPSNSASDETVKPCDRNAGYPVPLVNSRPLPIPNGPEIGQKEDAFDLMEEPDFMEDFPRKPLPIARSRSIDGQSGPGFVRYIQAGAESTNVGRCSPDDNQPGKLEPVRQDPITRPPEQLSTAVSHEPPLKRASSFDHASNADNKLLAPDTIIRGRSSSSSCLNSVSGSTTSPSTSHTRSSDSRSESRGRSSTRNSSYSDRERSNSRSSRSGGSPIGSISPCGSTIGIGGQSSGRESRSVYRQPGRERGRDRTGRRINGSSSSSSLSPPDVSSPIRSVTTEYVPAHTDSYSSLHDSMSQSIVSSACSSSSTIGPSSDSTSTVTQGSDDATEKAQPQIQPQPQLTSTVVSTPMHTRTSRSSRTGPIAIPAPIPEEEEIQRSRNPTPANSPTVAVKPLLPDPTSTAEDVIHPEDKREPMGEDSHPAGLVGRAVGMVNSARGLIGSFWHPGPL
ncbi:hypothetical protein BJ322DRAFT_804190 [Thelephora terrestris]|uniref:Nitrogen regulatory protein areA GATA-like domain-containing protein n=1 Tax=Thelephora terrestris TaxID=56493 RepID=A0A9P6HFS5_9AGAM|nr:hypothetical protein BJ322DRAFT_804190 [Thelephora terrestris]